MLNNKQKHKTRIKTERSVLYNTVVLSSDVHHTFSIHAERRRIMCILFQRRHMPFFRIRRKTSLNR